MPLPEFLALASACAPAIAPQTLAPIVQVESGFNPLAINVNGQPRLRVIAKTPAQAATLARRLIAAGRSVDLGLGQINSANLGWLGLSVESVFEPCRNLAAAGVVLRAGYRQALARGDDQQAAIRTALSFYNTGHPMRGFENGYVAKVTAAAQVLDLSAGTPTEPVSPQAPPAPAPPPAWDVFSSAGASPAAFVLRPPSAPETGDRP